MRNVASKEGNGHCVMPMLITSLSRLQYFPIPIDDAEKITSDPHSSNTLDTRLAQHRKRPYRE